MKGRSRRPTYMNGGAVSDTCLAFGRRLQRICAQHGERRPDRQSAPAQDCQPSTDWGGERKKFPGQEDARRKVAGEKRDPCLKRQGDRCEPVRFAPWRRAQKRGETDADGGVDHQKLARRRQERRRLDMRCGAGERNAGRSLKSGDGGNDERQSQRRTRISASAQQASSVYGRQNIGPDNDPPVLDAMTIAPGDSRAAPNKARVKRFFEGR